MLGCGCAIVHNSVRHDVGELHGVLDDYPGESAVGLLLRAWQCL